MSTNLVIVESPAKAKKIGGFLGSDYEVLASFGHVRDLVNKDGSVLPDEDFAMKWQLGERSDKHVRDIKSAVKKADTVWLAPDPDREGEAIAWHIHEILKEDGLLKGKEVRRVAFNEITKKAIAAAFEKTREIDQPLVNAYLARRALDYLVGFNLSPVLWRKLPGSRSAGRVQSVALRLICEREAEIEIFNPQEYWSIEARLHTKDGAPFTARLTHVAGNKLGKMDISNEADAMAAVERVTHKKLTVQKIEKKQVRRNPAPPFITSSLQMEASRKLGMSASQTMRTAQSLYEQGFITYMRTDGTTLSEEAVSQARDVIKSEYGAQYVPDAPRLYKSKAKNAQEAHEAIRPTELDKIPGKKGAPMGEDKERRLYELIWKRTMASQMENAIMDQMKVDISDGTDDAVLRANGSVVKFDGFLTLYQESTDKDDDENASTENENDRRLPPMEEGDSTKLLDTVPSQHFTQPPPRYSEATLVKSLEEKGIGRPSTYASIMQVLRDRNYVEMQARRFVPQDRGRVVTTFLAKFFTKYVDYDFTANLEEELDAIAAGHVEWKESLRQFWVDFKAAVDETKELTITNVIDYLDADLGPHFFPEGDESRKCQVCKDTHGDGRLGLKLGKFGAFIGCSNYPICKFTKPLVVPDANEDGDEAALANEPKILGQEPGTGRSVSLRKGPYGPYVQIDPAPESMPDMSEYDAEMVKYEEARATMKKEGKKRIGMKKPKKPTIPKPKRQGLPKGLAVADVDLEKALELLALPRDIGEHPESGLMIKAGIGMFGPFVLHDGKYASIPKDEDVMSIGMNRAVDLIAKKLERDAAKAAKQAEKGGTEGTTKTKPAAKKKKKTTTKKKTNKKAVSKKT